jgi:lipoprotein NlpD
VSRVSASFCGFVVLGLTLAACSSGPVQAPVIDRAPPAVAKAAPPRAIVDPRPEAYTVVRGDTLHSIALDHGLDYKELAAWNNLENPNLIRPGQQLRIKPPAGVQEEPVTVRPVTSAGRVEGQALPAQVPSRAEPARVEPSVKPSATVQDAVKSEPQARKLPYTQENVALMQRGEAQAKPAPGPAPVPPPAAASAPATVPAPARTDAEVDDEDKVDWGRPAQGKVIAGFSEASNKGLDIAGKPGDPVIASAPGRVVYSGSGLRGYGKLVIIKHNKTYLSAYAHNRDILVKEGQSVIKGQKIAEIGNTDSDAPKLHFEIRKLGKPVDPAKYLPAQ